MLPELNPEQIQDLENAHQVIKLLLNLVEELKQENIALRAEVQTLRDEINRLKGEQGKPKIKPGKKKSDHSSEKERRQPQKWRKESKVDKIVVNREEKLTIDRNQLPDDAQFKGYETVVIQDIDLKTDNIRFHKEKYYSPSQRQSYLAELPIGYEGEFGPGIRALVLTLYYGSEMTEPKIREFLQHLGIMISAGQLSNLLTKKQEQWQEEKTAIYRAGLASGSWQHIDDTSTRVNGENHYCHVVGNPFYTAYFTRPRKDRLTVIGVLQNETDPSCLLNEETSQWLDLFGIPQWAQRQIETWPQEELLAIAELTTLVTEQLERLNKQQQARVLEAAALTAYHSQTEMPIVPNLLSDDAPQFRFVTAEQSLCWIHDGRHYKKLLPVVAYHQQLLTDFQTAYWDYYRQLQAYRQKPTPQQAEALDHAFDTLFSRETGYHELDKRIAKTKAKKDRLLKVLSHPEIPLHNNPAELGARRRVRKRDISFGPRTMDGVTAWDTFMTLAATAKKLGVSFYAYIYDRVAGLYALPDLAELITQLAPAYHPLPMREPN